MCVHLGLLLGVGGQMQELRRVRSGIQNEKVGTPVEPGLPVTSVVIPIAPLVLPIAPVVLSVSSVVISYKMTTRMCRQCVVSYHCIDLAVLLNFMYI